MTEKAFKDQAWEVARKVAAIDKQLLSSHAVQAFAALAQLAYDQGKHDLEVAVKQRDELTRYAQEVKDAILPFGLRESEWIPTAIKRCVSELAAVRQERDESACEAAAALKFMDAEMGWENFRAETLCHDDEAKRSQSLENARLLKNYLAQKGHGIKMLTRLQALEELGENS